MAAKHLTQAQPQWCQVNKRIERIGRFQYQEFTLCLFSLFVFQEEKESISNEKSAANDELGERYVLMDRNKSSSYASIESISWLLAESSDPGGGGAWGCDLGYMLGRGCSRDACSPEEGG